MIATERAQVIDSLQARVRELDVLSQVGQAVNFTIEFDDLLELISAQTGKLIDAPNFYIVLHDPTTMRGIPGDVTMLPVLFKQAGYATGHFGKWHLGIGRPEYLPTNRGFDSAMIRYPQSNGAYWNPDVQINGEQEVRIIGHMTGWRPTNYCKRKRLISSYPIGKCLEWMDWSF